MVQDRPLRLQVPRGGIVVAESVHGPAFTMAEQQDPFHELVHVVRGEVTADLKGERRSLRAGAFLVIPAGTAHRFVDRQAATLLLMGIDRVLIDRDAERRTLFEILFDQGPVVQPNRLDAERLRWLWRVRMAAASGSAAESARFLGARNGGPGSGTARAAEGAAAESAECTARVERTERAARSVRTVQTRAQLDEVLVLLFRALGREREGRGLERVRELAERLPHELYEPWTVERAAKAVNLSTRRFSELYQQERGESFPTAVQRLRIERCCAELEHGSGTIAGTAFSCGFEDLSSFYRAFRRHTGTTPGAWLRDRGLAERS